MLAKMQFSIFRQHFLNIMSVKHVKLVFVGDHGVGKTSLINLFENGFFSMDYIPEIFNSYLINLFIGPNSYKIQDWDTSGHCNYDKLRPLSYPQTDIFIVCYSISDPKSLKNVKNKWIPEIETHCPNTPFILAGLKSDLRDDFGENYCESIIVSHQEGELFSHDVRASDFIECSAFKRVNVNELFEAALMIFEHHGTRNKKHSFFYHDCNVV